MVGSLYLVKYLADHVDACDNLAVVTARGVTEGGHGACMCVCYYIREFSYSTFCVCACVLCAVYGSGARFRFAITKNR